MVALIPPTPPNPQCNTSPNSTTDRALGSLGSGNAAIGNMFWGVKLTNNTGTTITSLDVSYVGEQWRNSAAAAQTVSFSYLVGSPSVSGTLAEFQSAGVAVSALDFTSPVTGGTATALNGNLAANRTAKSATITVNIPNGTDIMLRWSDPDHTGADHGLSIDDFSVTPQGTVVGDTAPSVSSTTPADNATGVALNSDISVNFSESVSVSGSSFTVSCASSGAHTFALTGSGSSYTLNPDSDFASNETCTVTVVANQVSDPDANDPPDNMAADYVFDFTTVFVVGACGDAYTPTFTIQGSGTTSPKADESHNTEAVVIGDFQTGSNLSGFYIQDPSGDGNTSTSDGLFVADGASPAVNVSVGDRVRVSGTVSESFGNTVITPSSPVQICSTGNTLPAPTVYDLPEPVDGDLERVENMLVNFPETLTVTGNFTWGRFGELFLSADGRLYQQNSFDRPNTAGALARASFNERAYVVLDDGKSVQNPNPIPYQSPDPTRRAGDTATGLTGVLTFDFSEYRLQPTVAPVFTQANPRPAAPASVGGTLKVASSNVLNYFNGDGAGGGFPTARGATTQAEFNRQRAKIIAALVATGADIIGVSEMENDGGGSTSALQDLVNGMNAATAPGTYVGLHSPNPGTDLIQNAIIYKPASVTPVGSQVNDVNSAWDQARPPLAQTFTQNSNGEKFTFIVNHFTSKGCSANDTGADADQGDGQGCDNFQRQQQANRLLVFIQDRKTASGDPDVLSVGDYNAYGEEDPNFILEQDASDTLADGAGGLVSQSKRFVPMNDRYSFQFDNQFGELDHAFATKSLNNQVSGTIIWHINADEPVAIDYNTEFKTQDLYTPTPYRAADHDPLIVGLNLTSAAPLPAGSLLISEYRLRGPGGTTDEFVEIYNNTDTPITVQTIDGSAGFALVASDGTTRFTIPNGDSIPARGHYLGCNSAGYTLASYPAGDGTTANCDATYTADIPDQSGLALFNSAPAANFDTDHRLDAVGYDSAPSLYREGSGFSTNSPGNEVSLNIEYSFLRDLTAGTPKDTQDNNADFIPVSTNANVTSIGRRLGAPGPENRSGPVRKLTVFVDRLDQLAPVSSPPNRVRRTCSDPQVEECDANRSILGTLALRRTVNNYTGQPVTQLRFRVIDITAGPAATGTADIRVIPSSDITVTLTNGQQVPVQGTVVEQPPTQSTFGGGWNTSLSPTGTINLANPIPPNASVNVQFLFGVMQGGTFRVYINVEALP